MSAFRSVLNQVSNATYAKRKRAAKMTVNRCIDEPVRELTHGPIHKGRRCEVCWTKSRRKSRRP